MLYQLTVLNQPRRSWLIYYLTFCRNTEPSERMFYTVTALST